MIYITQGLQVNGVTVTFLTLTELFNIFDSCPPQSASRQKISMRNIVIDRNIILKALPIHIESNDIPLLKRLWQLRDVLTRDVVFQINTPLTDVEQRLLQNTGRQIETLPTANSPETSSVLHNQPCVLGPTCSISYQVPFWILFGLSILMLFMILCVFFDPTPCARKRVVIIKEQ